MTRFVRTTGFSRGEVDESLYDREDVDFYASASRRLLNFFPDRIGSVRRRGGTEQLATQQATGGGIGVDGFDGQFGTDLFPYLELLSTAEIVFEFRDRVTLVEFFHVSTDVDEFRLICRARPVTRENGRVQLGERYFSEFIGISNQLTDEDVLTSEIDYAQIGPALFIASKGFPPHRIFYNAAADDVAILPVEFRREMIGSWTPSANGEAFEAEEGEAVAQSELTATSRIFFDGVEYTADTITDETINVVEDLSGLVRRTLPLSYPVTIEAGFGGNPRYVAANKGRLIFAATEAKPTGVWAGKPNEPFVMFGSEVFDDSPIDVELLDAGLDEIRWMSGRDLLYIGGGQAEFAVGETDQPLTPGNFGARRVGSDGSRRVRPVQTGSEIYFANEPGTQVMGVQFDFSTQGFVSSDLSLLAPHLTAPKVKQIAFRPPTNYDRTPRMFFVKEDEQLCTLALDRAQDVVAWNSIEFPEGINIQSVAAGREIVFIRYVFGTRYGLLALSTEARPDFLLDLSQVAEPDENSVIDIPPLYRGTILSVVSSEQGLLDEFELGGSQTTLDLSGFGTPEELGDLLIGYRFRSEIEMLAGAYEFRNGTALSRKRRLVRSIVSVRDTREVTVQGQPLLGQTPFSDDQVPPPRTGQFERRLLGWNTDDALRISVEGVYPATILSVVREYST